MIVFFFIISAPPPESWSMAMRLAIVDKITLLGEKRIIKSMFHFIRYIFIASLDL